MANRDRLHTGDIDFVTLFARTPQLCAGALAGLGSALWINVVGPFAGLVAAWGSLVLANALAVAVVAALAMLAITAGTLLAADWRAEDSDRQAWAEIDVATVELRLPAESVAPPQIDPRYLTSTDALPSVFRAHRFTSPAPAPSTHSPSAVHSAAIVLAPGEFLSSETALTIPSKIGTGAAIDVAMGRKSSSASFGREPPVVASCRRQPRTQRAEPAVGVARLVANGEICLQWMPHDMRVLTRVAPRGYIADIVVLSGECGDRDQRECAPDPSAGDGAVKSDEPPSCRGPPSSIDRPSRSLLTVPEEPSVEKSGHAGPTGPQPSANHIVRDNLGHQVPVCAGELDVIQTYLNRALQDLLGSGAAAPDREKS
jgi:hypothetical protein